MATRRKPDAKATAFNAVRALSEHPCVHPPSCAHRYFRECRDALAAAITAAWGLVRTEAGESDAS